MVGRKSLAVWGIVDTVFSFIQLVHAMYRIKKMNVTNFRVLKGQKDKLQTVFSFIGIWGFVELYGETKMPGDTSTEDLTELARLS
jgi:hypothetical protein